MALTTPIIFDIGAFDANDDYTMSFYVTGGDQVTKNEIQITNNTTSAIVFTNTVFSYVYTHVIPKGKLSNGVTYSIKVRTYNSTNEVSAWSNPVVFTCYTEPTIKLNITDGQQVNSSSVYVSMEYNQAQGELFNYGIITLYDESKTALATSSYLYNESPTLPLSVNFTFNGLINLKTYYIKAECYTVDDTYVETPYIKITIHYSNPVLYSIFQAEPNNCDGYVDLNSKIVILTGRANGSATFENHSSINTVDTFSDINNSRSIWVEWNKFVIPSNFLFRLWFNPAQVNKKIATMYASDGSERVNFTYVRDDNYDYIYIESQNGVKIKSNGIPHNNGSVEDFLWVKVVDNNWEVKLSQLTKKASDFRWNVRTTNLRYNMTTDIHYGKGTYEDFSFSNNVNKALKKMDSLRIGNGVFYHINLSNDTSISYTDQIPTIFDYRTILDCAFKDNLSSGNMDTTLSQVSKIKIKRQDENTKTWITVYEKNISKEEDLAINFNDHGVPSDVTQTYALVPVMSGDVEGDYVTIDTTPKWDGVFISDGKQTFKLYNAVTYEATTQNMQLGSLQPINSLYPILIQNATTNYKSGSLSAQILGYNFEKTRRIDRRDAMKQANDLMQFLTNGKSKFLIDWNGNAIICKTFASPSASFANNFGNGFTTVSFSWVEQGKYYSEEDIYENGLSNIKQ